MRLSDQLDIEADAEVARQAGPVCSTLVDQIPKEQLVAVRNLAASVLECVKTCGTGPTHTQLKKHQRTVEKLQDAEHSAGGC